MTLNAAATLGVPWGGANEDCGPRPGTEDGLDQRYSNGRRYFRDL